MAISKIQYDDKVAINIDSTIPDINKCNASDLNEIKSVVNNNADEIPTISNEYGTSTTDGYSQNYINGNTINPSGEPSTSEEDVSSATFTNTLEAPMNIDLKGNTSQTGTPTPSSPIPINNVSGDNQVNVVGKNHYNINVNYDWIGIDTNYTITGNTINVNGKYFVAGLHSVKPNTNYTISAIRQIIQDNDTCGKIRVFTPNKSQMLGEGNTTFTFNTGNNNQVYVLLYAGLNKQGNVDFSNIQLEQGSSASSYLPYSSDTYNIDLPVENLFDKDNANVLNAYFNSTTPTISQDVGSRTIYISCKPNTTYTISKTITNRFAIGYTTTTPALNVSVSGVIQNNSANSITITTGNNATHLVVFMWISTDTKTYTEVRDTLQIEYGSKSNTYTPYGTTPIELNKIGTYQDYFYKDSGKWYLHKETGKYTFTGNENFTWDSDKQRIIIPISNLGINTPPLTTSQLFNIYNQKVIGTTFDNLYNKVVDNCIALSTGNSISIRSTGFDSLNTGKNTIANTDLYYILATPTNTEITYTPLIEQLESIKNARSKEGTTNINQVNNDAPFMLDLSVFNDNYNGRYESLVAMINKLSQ